MDVSNNISIKKEFPENSTNANFKNLHNFKRWRQHLKQGNRLELDEKMEAMKIWARYFAMKIALKTSCSLVCSHSDGARFYAWWLGGLQEFEP